jgi:hypothetical protein
MEDIRFLRLLDYSDEEIRRRKRWFVHNPAVLETAMHVAAQAPLKIAHPHLPGKAHFAEAVSGGRTSSDELLKAAEQPPTDLNEIFGISEDALQNSEAVTASGS